MEHKKNTKYNYLTDQVVRTLPQTQDAVLTGFRREAMVEFLKARPEEERIDDLKNMQFSQITAIHNVVMALFDKTTKDVAFSSPQDIAKLTKSVNELHKTFLQSCDAYSGNKQLLPSIEAHQPIPPPYEDPEMLKVPISFPKKKEEVKIHLRSSPPRQQNARARKAPD